MTKFSLVEDAEGKRTVTIYPKDGKPLSVDDSHPQFDKLERALYEGKPEEQITKLADPVRVVDGVLSERVTVRNGIIYFDNDPLNNAIADQIIRVLASGDSSPKPLINFLEKISSNPSDNSRKQLYSWLENTSFTITPDGDIIGYKSVESDKANSPGIKHRWYSINHGEAIINGKEHKEGKVPQSIGDVVEIARSKVIDDPSKSCSVGLHVANWDFAKKFSGDTVLEVLVNPRDVVSVPDSGKDKIRCCRYKILGIAEKPYTDPIYEHTAAWNENIGHGMER